MAARGNISTTLTLDSSKFEKALDKATADLSKFDERLKSASKISKDFDKAVGSMSGVLNGSADKFKTLNKTVEGLVSKFNAVSLAFEETAKNAGGVRKASEELNSSLGSTSKGMSEVSRETERARVAMESLKPSITKAIESQKSLAAAQKASALAAQESTSSGIRASIAALDTEKSITSERLMLKRNALRDLEELERKFISEADFRRDQAARAERRLGAYGGKNIIAGHMTEATRLDANAGVARSQIDSIRAQVEAMAARNREIAQSIPLLYRSADAAKAVETAEQRAAATAIQAGKDREKAAIEAARVEREKAREVAHMWKGLGEMYAASKIKDGLGAVIGKSSEMQSANLRVQSQGFSPKEMEEFNRKAYDLARQEKYLSNIDAINARLTAVASIGVNDQRIIDGTISSATRTAFALKQMGYEQGSQTDVMRNLYGLAEARQVMNDPTKTKETFDTAFRISRASDGKINMGDMETVFRNLGPLAITMSKDGMINTAALMEQFKVSGGHGGASGAGVSSVGTILKMLSLYATGKTQSVNAVKELAAAGVLDTASIAGFNGGNSANKEMISAARNAGFANSNELLANPIEYLKKIREPILQMMQSKKHRAEYFGKSDITDSKAQDMAFEKFAAKAGWSNKTIQAFVIAMNEAFQQRAGEVATRAKSGMGADDAAAAAMKNWTGATQQFKSSVDNLASSFTTVLQPLTGVVNAITKMVDATTQFAKNNPMAAELSLAAVAAGGLVLAFKSFTFIFGTVSKLGDLLDALVMKEGLAGTAATVAAEKTALMGTAEKVAAEETALAGTAAEVTAAKTTLMGAAAETTASTIGKAFLRAIPLVGAFLLGWDFGKMLMEMEVSGHKISDWVGSFMDTLITEFDSGWARIADIFTLGMNHAEYAARVAKNNLDLMQRHENVFGDKTPTQDPNGRSAAALALDHVNSPVVDPMTGKKWSEEPKMKARPEPKEAAPEKKASDPYTPHDLSGVGSGKDKHPPEDLFKQSLANWTRRSQLDNLKYESLRTGNDNYAARAKVSFIESWLGGQFDPGHNPNARPFKINKKGSGEDISNLDLTGSSQKNYMKEVENAMRLEDQIKGVKEAQQLLSEKQLQAKEAALGAATGITKVSAAMRALEDAFQRAEARNPTLLPKPGQPQSQQSKDYVEAKRGALAAQSEVDSAVLIDKLKKEVDGLKFKGVKLNKNGGITAGKIGFNSDGSLVTQRQMDIMASLSDVSDAQKNLTDFQNETKKPDGRYKSYAAESIKTIEESLKTLVAEKQARVSTAGITPLQELTTGWSQLSGNLEAIQPQMAGGAMSFMERMTNPWQYGGFYNGIVRRYALRDSLTQGAIGLKNQFLHSAMAQPLQYATSSLGDGLIHMVGGKTTKEYADQGITNPAAQQAKMMSDIATHFKSMVGDVGGWFKNMISSAGNQLSSLWPMLQKGFESIMSMLSSGSGGASSAISSAASSVGSWAQSSASGIGSWVSSFFADGGIMTQYGAAPLRKYANGGIANSPQLAMFGEGSSPEAYVPLPDGRSIPVSMKGATNTQSGSNVSIIINVASDGSATSSGDTKSAFTGMANQVKNVVLTELVNQQRPGGLLYK